jgi:uncharacterized protein YodC (DUF2158 family)
MEHDFKEGDVVQLKSGGPKMTIAGIGKYGMGADHDSANCVWFDGPNQKSHVFELHSLNKISQ